MAMVVSMRLLWRSQCPASDRIRGDHQPEVCPEDLGLTRAGLDLLRGGDCTVNQQILQDVLQGQGSLPQTEVVAFNTALVLWAAGLQLISRRGCAGLDSLSEARPGRPCRPAGGLSDGMENE